MFTIFFALFSVLVVVVIRASADILEAERLIFYNEFFTPLSGNASGLSTSHFLRGLVTRQFCSPLFGKCPVCCMSGDSIVG